MKVSLSRFQSKAHQSKRAFKKASRSARSSAAAVGGRKEAKRGEPQCKSEPNLITMHYEEVEEDDAEENNNKMGKQAAENKCSSLNLIIAVTWMEPPL